MNFRTLLGILISLIIYSCAQHPSKKLNKVKDDSNKHTELTSFFKIENRINRGGRYTNSDSINYWLVHIASAITNISSILIELKMTFSEEYGYPSEYGDQVFNVFLLPRVFTLDEVTKVTGKATYTDSMQVRLLKYIEVGMDTPYRLIKTIEPG